MARIECHSAQRGVPPVLVEIEKISDAQIVAAQARLDRDLALPGQISDAVASAFARLCEEAPEANPSDLWHHVIYRHLLASGWSDARWKRVSGFALERALVQIYQSRLAAHDIRMRIVPKAEAVAILEALGVDDAGHTKLDLFLEGRRDGKWVVFGAAHVKASIAERIQDDVPASVAFMRRGLLSILLTMDAKSYPPPHGTCVNFGELGGRSFEADANKARLKRAYIEEAGQFDALFSFNLRTPPSRVPTSSGKAIHASPLYGNQPDPVVDFIVERWRDHPNAIEV